MAGRFGKGLLHGVLLGSAAVLALAVILPPPAPVEQSSVAGATPNVPPPVLPLNTEPATPTAVAEPAPAPAPETATQEGQDMGLPVPAGSEFMRSGDLTPLLPGPLDGPAIALGPERPPVAPDAQSEAAPALITETATRPEPRIGAPVEPSPLAPAGVPIDLPVAPSREAPIPVPPPGKVRTPGLDRGPETPGEAASAPVGRPRPETAPAIAAPQAGPDEAMPADTAPSAVPGVPDVTPERLQVSNPSDVAPALSQITAPGLDAPLPDAGSPGLPVPEMARTTPPDLSDLQALQPSVEQDRP